MGRRIVVRRRRVRAAEDEPGRERAGPVVHSRRGVEVGGNSIRASGRRRAINARGIERLGGVGVKIERGSVGAAPNDAPAAQDGLR